MAFFATPKGASRRMVFEDSVLPVIEAGQAITIGAKGGDYLGNFTFLPTPGHSSGHMSISRKTGGEEAIFTGDVAHNPVQIHHPEWVSAFCAEVERSRASRRWLLDYAGDRNAMLFTAHFPESSVGVVARRDGGFTWKYLLRHCGESLRRFRGGVRMASREICNRGLAVTILADALHPTFGPSARGIGSRTSVAHKWI